MPNFITHIEPPCCPLLQTASAALKDCDNYAARTGLAFARFELPLKTSISSLHQVDKGFLPIMGLVNVNPSEALNGVLSAQVSKRYLYIPFRPTLNRKRRVQCDGILLPNIWCEGLDHVCDGFGLGWGCALRIGRHCINPSIDRTFRCLATIACCNSTSTPGLLVSSEERSHVE